MKILLVALILLAYSNSSFSEACRSDTLFKHENKELKDIQRGDVGQLIPINIFGEIIHLPNRFSISMMKGRQGFSLVTYSAELESYFQCEFEGEQFLFGSIEAGAIEDCSLCKEAKEEKAGFPMKIEKLALEGGFHKWTYHVPNARPIVVVFDGAQYLKIVDRNDFLSESIAQQLGLDPKYSSEK